ncbi:hypothetical protein NX059_003714 [Plenodomus lindquistii]|nr:hypothetical protein NX059_003714 [Plenodomus lindquistii]
MASQHRAGLPVTSAPPSRRMNNYLRNQTTSPLLRLPAELRNRIYGYVYTEKSIMILRDTKSGRTSWYTDVSTEEYHAQYRKSIRYPFSSLLASTAICRQIYAEANMLPFRLNTISVIRMEPIAYMLRKWSRKHREAIGGLRLGLQFSVAEDIDLLHEFKCLKAFGVQEFKANRMFWEQLHYSSVTTGPEWCDKCQKEHTLMMKDLPNRALRPTREGCINLSCE